MQSKDWHHVHSFRKVAKRGTVEIQRAAKDTCWQIFVTLRGGTWEKVELKVQLGQKLKAGETVVGVFK